jgi:putative ABC transport system permease protein
VNSLEQNIQNEVSSLGNNTIYIDKWDYSGGPDKPFWKMRARPVMKYEEAAMLKGAFGAYTGCNFSYANRRQALAHAGDMLSNVSVYGINEAQMAIQPISFEAGQVFLQCRIQQCNQCRDHRLCQCRRPVSVKLQRAIGKQVDLKGKKITIIGVIKKEGKNFIGWDYDNCIMLPYKFCRTIFQEDNSNPILIVKGKAGVSTDALYQELRGIMRQVRRLKPYHGR